MFGHIFPYVEITDSNQRAAVKKVLNEVNDAETSTGFPFPSTLHGVNPKRDTMRSRSKSLRTLAL